MRFRYVLTCAAASLVAACSTTPAASDGAAPRGGAAEAEGRLLRVGDVVTDSIVGTDPTWGTNGGFHLYRFQADEGARLVVEMKSDDFDTYLVLGDRTGGIFNPIVYDDDSGGLLDARIRYTAPRTGTFWILAQAYAEYGTGAYTISLQPMPEPRPAQAVAVTLGATVRGTLDETDPLELDEEKHYDLYTFDAVEGSRYSIELASSDFDAYLIVGRGNPDFVEIARNDDSAGSTDARVIFSPDEAGRYSVRATSFDGEAGGDYALTIRELVSGGPAVVTPLQFGRTIRGELTDTDPMSADGSLYDVYSFSGREGQRISITMRSDALDSYLMLGEPDEPDEEYWGDHSDDDSAGNLDARITTTLWRTGEYHVRANSLYPDEVGSYEITLEELPEPGPPSVRPIEVGSSVTGSLDAGDAILGDGSHYDIYTFRGSAGQRVRITLASSDFDAYLQFGPWDGEDIDITDGDDDSAGGESGYDARLELTLPAAGTYAIMANSLGANSVGLYTVTLDEM